MHFLAHTVGFLKRVHVFALIEERYQRLLLRHFNWKLNMAIQVRYDGQWSCLIRGIDVITVIRISCTFVQFQSNLRLYTCIRIYR